jgi:hypothetical protein
VPVGFDTRLGAAGLGDGAWAAAMMEKKTKVNPTMRTRMLTSPDAATAIVSQASIDITLGENPENCAGFFHTNCGKVCGSRQVTAPLQRFRMGFQRFAPGWGASPVTH